MSTILITRPAEEAKQLAAAMAEQGVQSLIEPMLTIAPLPTARMEVETLDARQFQAVVITSQHAAGALHLPPALLALPVFAVGMKTAKAARRMGWGTVHVGVRGVEDLAEHVARNCQPRRGALLYLRAQQVSHPIQPLLPDYNIKEIITYRAVPATSLTAKTREAIAQSAIDAVMFFSRQSAHTFEALSAELSLGGLHAMCISPMVAAALTPSRWKTISSADYPTQSAVLALLCKIG